jgi:hypothetical protein
MISMSATPIKPKTWRRYRQMCQDGERHRHSQPDAAGRRRARDQQGQRSQDLDQSGDDPKPLADPIWSNICHYRISHPRE